MNYYVAVDGTVWFDQEEATEYNTERNEEFSSEEE